LECTIEFGYNAAYNLKELTAVIAAAAERVQAHFVAVLFGAFPTTIEKEE
jgi:hypothetical protein